MTTSALYDLARSLFCAALARGDVADAFMWARAANTLACRSPDLLPVPTQRPQRTAYRPRRPYARRLPSGALVSVARRDDVLVGADR